MNVPGYATFPIGIILFPVPHRDAVRGTPLIVQPSCGAPGVTHNPIPATLAPLLRSSMVWDKVGVGFARGVERVRPLLSAALFF